MKITRLPDFNGYPSCRVDAGDKVTVMQISEGAQSFIVYDKQCNTYEKIAEVTRSQVSNWLLIAGLAFLSISFVLALASIGLAPKVFSSLGLAALLISLLMS